MTNVPSGYNNWNDKGFRFLVEICYIDPCYNPFNELALASALK